MSGARPRAAAARVIADVLGGRSLDQALGAREQAGGDSRDRALGRAIAYGVIRYYPRLEVLAGLLLDRPLPTGQDRLHALVLAGLYQLGHMDVPDHAAVSATVDAAPAIGSPRARGLVNAVLRRYLRERAELEARLDSEPVARHAHPAWMIERLAADWPAEYPRIMEVANRLPPMWLRVNLHAGGREDYAAAVGAASTPGAHAPAALMLETPRDVAELPGFSEGRVSVQDAAAQLAAPLVAPRPGERILDACAAPGGKTAHLLELCPGIRLTALDRSTERLERVRENLRRLGLVAECRAADAAEPEGWWDGEAFDAVLLDAPCSGSGVIRRHPDIKLLRRPGDVAGLATTQDRLLDGLWRVLRPGGRLLYATCSVYRQENEARIAAFLARTPDAAAKDPAALGRWGRLAGGGRQILPGEEEMDGFYYACLTRASQSHACGP